MAAKQTTSILTLPHDVLLHIFTCVASSSAIDIFVAQRVCKRFYALGSNVVVIQALCLDQLFQEDLPFYLWDDYRKFLRRCMLAGNRVAIFGVAFTRFLKGERGDDILSQLRSSADQGYRVATYVVSVLDICTGNPAAIVRAGALLDSLHVGAEHRREVIMGIRETVCRVCRPIWPAPPQPLQKMGNKRLRCDDCPGVASIDVVVLQQQYWDVTDLEQRWNILDVYEQCYDILCSRCYWDREAVLFTNRISSGSWVAFP